MAASHSNCWRFPFPYALTSIAQGSQEPQDSGLLSVVVSSFSGHHFCTLSPCSDPLLSCHQLALQVLSFNYPSFPDAAHICNRNARKSLEYASYRQAHINLTNRLNSGINPQLFFDTFEHVTSPFTSDFAILKQDLTAFPKCKRIQYYISLSPTLSFFILLVMYLLSNYTPSHLVNEESVTTFYSLQSHIVRQRSSPCTVTGDLAACTVYSFVSVSEYEPQQIKHVFQNAFVASPGKGMRQPDPIIAKKMLPC